MSEIFLDKLEGNKRGEPHMELRATEIIVCSMFLQDSGALDILNKINNRYLRSWFRTRRYDKYQISTFEGYSQPSSNTIGARPDARYSFTDVTKYRELLMQYNNTNVENSEYPELQLSINHNNVYSIDLVEERDKKDRRFSPFANKFTYRNRDENPEQIIPDECPPLLTLKTEDMSIDDIKKRYQELHQVIDILKRPDILENARRYTERRMLEIFEANQWLYNQK